jgi:hypothetical protein
MFRATKLTMDGDSYSSGAPKSTTMEKDRGAIGLPGVAQTERLKPDAPRLSLVF